MNSQKSKIIKYRVDSLYNKHINKQNFLNKFTKSDIEYIFNDQNLCNNFITGYLHVEIRETLDCFWTNRAINFIECLVEIIFKFKTEYNISITPNLISHYLYFDNLYRLNNFFKKINIDNNLIDKYIKSLPGINKNHTNNIPVVVYEQHGYISMQFSEIFNLLVNKYNFSNKIVNLESLCLINKLNKF